MSLDQLQVHLKESKDVLFRLRLQSRMEKLDAPSELRKNKKNIAQILTELTRRENENKAKQ